MSGDNSDSDRELRREQIRAGIVKTHDVHVTVRFGCAVFGIVLAIAIICWAVVRINTPDSWFTFGIAIFGPTGTVVVIFGAYIAYLKWQKRKLLKAIESEEEAE